MLGYLVYLGSSFQVFPCLASCILHQFKFSRASQALVSCFSALGTNRFSRAQGWLHVFPLLAPFQPFCTLGNSSNSSALKLTAIFSHACQQLHFPCFSLIGRLPEQAGRFPLLAAVYIFPCLAPVHVFPWFCLPGRLFLHGTSWKFAAVM